MAYIQPDSRIEFFTDINITADYVDSLYFSSETEKNQAFSNIPKLAYVERCYYSRDNRGFVRVELPMSTMIKAQYMRFKNTSYENKWWYAFVRDVVYINDNTTEVQFQLDPLMTWMGNFTLSECFVERQHGETDEIGDNLVDEPLDTGEYVTIGDSNTGLFDDWVYTVFYTVTPAGAVAIPDNHVFDQLGIYSGLRVQIFPDDRYSGATGRPGLSQLTAFLLQDPILINVQMIMHVPEKFIPKMANYVPAFVGAPDYSQIQRDYAPLAYDVSVTRNTKLDGEYEPKNNKLFTYPYNFFTIWNSEEKESEYRYELFQLTPTNKAFFKVFSNVGEPTEAMCVPMAYRGISLNYSEASIMNEFTPCTWVSDAFMGWLAQTLSSSPTRLLAGSFMDGLTNSTNAKNSALTVTNREIDKGSTVDSDVYIGETGNTMRTTVTNNNKITEHSYRPAGAQRTALGGVLAVRGVLLDGFSHLTTPSSAHGKPSNSILEVEREKEFWFYQKSIRREYAEIIDGYFTMFGYAQKKVMQPNMHARTRFTYIKTRDCKIHCECPASDAEVIENIFNNGIRFWNSVNYIGDYHTDNPPYPRPSSNIQEP